MHRIQQNQQQKKFSGKISSQRTTKGQISTFHEREKIEASIKRAKRELKEILQALVEGKSTFSYEGKICNAVPIDFHRCLSEWSRKSSLDLAIRNIIISSFFSSEVLAGGTGIVACALWTQDLEEKRSMGRALSFHVKDAIQDFGRSGLSSTVSQNLFELGACGCEVSLKEGSQDGTKIEVFEGEELPGHIDNLFLSRIPNANFSREHYMIAIDGVIESTSQIHGLLESIGNQPAIIIARSFFPDVSNTLAENFSSGKLSTVPYVVSSWGVKNFLDLSDRDIVCASTEIGSELSLLRASTKIQSHVSPGNLVYCAKNKRLMRKISVSFGKDLASLRGISLDRTKILLSIMRLASRRGISECEILGKEFRIPTVTLQNSKKLIESLDRNLHNLGGVISFSA